MAAFDIRVKPDLSDLTLSDWHLRYQVLSEIEGRHSLTFLRGYSISYSEVPQGMHIPFGQN